MEEEVYFLLDLDPSHLDLDLSHLDPDQSILMFHGQDLTAVQYMTWCSLWTVQMSPMKETGLQY